MYHTYYKNIKKGTHMFEYCEHLSYNAARLYNRAYFVVRQYFFACCSFNKMKPLSEHEMEVYNLVTNSLNGTKFEPKSVWLNAYQLDFLFKKVKDFDYYNLPAQVNWHVLVQLIEDLKSYFENKKFDNKTRMPHYKKEFTTVNLTNQVCKIHNRLLRFPKCKNKLRVKSHGVLKSVRIKPVYDYYRVECIFEDNNILPNTKNEDMLNELSQMTDFKNTIAIDLGVNNLAAVTNTMGLKPFIIKGTYLKSLNRYYNKEIAHFKSLAMTFNNNYSTHRIERLFNKRNNQINDYMHKASRMIVQYCIDNDVEYVVIGLNTYWKQNTKMGKVNNQNFVQIPFTKLINMLQYKLASVGIKCVLQEESYTSKADYKAFDTIPVYGKEKGEPKFSGKRIKRGLYRHYNNSLSNADINGSANILRKVYQSVPRTRWGSCVVDTPLVQMVA